MSGIHGVELLTDIPEIKNPSREYYRNCPWLPNENDEYKNNIQNLIILQKWAKNNYKYHKTVLCLEYIKTKEFREWYHDPKNPGGKRDKASIEKFLRDINKKQNESK